MSKIIFRLLLSKKTREKVINNADALYLKKSDLHRNYPIPFIISPTSQ